MADGIRLVAQPLTAEGFAAFGTVIRNDRHTRQQPVDGLFDTDGVAGGPALTLMFIADAATWPVPVPKLERHPHSAQGFLALNGSACVVLACGSLLDGSPDLASLTAFVAAPDQGVIYHRNVWHKGITPLSSGAEFAMLMVKAAAGDDTLFAELDLPVTVLPA